MQINRLLNAKKNMITGVIYQMVSLLLPFVIQTVTIYKLGVEYVGIKGLFGAILSVFSLAELGVGSAIVYSMYEPIAKDDIDEICALLNLYKRLYKVIGVAIVVMGIIVLPLLPQLIKGEYPSDINIYIVFIMFLAGTVSTYFFYGYKASLLFAFQRRDVVNNISTWVSISISVIQIVVLVVAKSYYGYLILAVMASIINNVVTAYMVNKMYPNIRCRGKVSEEQLNDIKKKVAGLMIGKICSVTRNSLDVIFISAFVGLLETSLYSNYYYILTMVSGFFFVFLDSIKAGIGNKTVIESTETNYNDYLFLNYAYMMVVGWCAVCMACLYQPFMKIWVGNNLMFPNGLMILFPLYFYELRMSNITMVYSEARGLYWEQRFCCIAQALFNIILNYALGRCFGVTGVLLATMVIVFTMDFCWQISILYKCYFERSKKTIFSQHLRSGLITLCIGVVVIVICAKITIKNDWCVLIVRALICCTLVPMIYCVLNWNNKYFKSIKDVVRNSIYR